MGWNGRNSPLLAGKRLGEQDVVMEMAVVYFMITFTFPCQSHGGGPRKFLIFTLFSFFLL